LIDINEERFALSTRIIQRTLRCANPLALCRV